MKSIRSILTFVLLAAFSATAFAGPVNINEADAATLAENIRGVGPKLAERIVMYRDQEGQFASVEDLINVKGIGEKMIEKNRDILKLMPIPTDQ